MTDVSNGIIMMNPYFGHLLNPQMIGKQTSFPGEKYIQSIFQPRTDVPSEDLLDCHEQNAQSSASCPVCKKEFCNEEYLRLHMVNRHSDHFFAREFTTEHGDESMDEDDKDQQNDDPSKESDRDDEISMHMQYQNENNMFCSTNEDQKLDDNFENESSFTSEQCSGEQRSEDAAVKIEKLQNSKNKMYSFRDHFLPFANNTSDCDHFKVDSKFFLPNSEDSSALQNSLDERLFASTVSNSSSQILFSKNYQHISTSSIDGGNSIGAKLSERVVCDICNKQVCNKYFLKTHKSRVHGINSEKVNESQIYSSSLDQQKISYKQRLTNSCSPSFNNDCHDGIEGGGGGNDNSSQDSSQEDLQQLDLSIQNSMSEQERNDLLKNNIDPEAYCTICKKEFCSKYFLRTHQQNIHKVKQTLIVNTTPKKVRCSSKDSITTKVKSLSPAQTRVTCSICNKELCNKYFLRSHMMNVHNIMGEEQRRECEDNRLNPLIKSERIEYSQMMPDYQRIPSVNIYDESSLNSLSLFKCPICGECLNSQNECSEHSRKVHGVTAGAALVAKRSFNNISNSDQSSDLCPPSKSKEGRLDFPGFSGMQPFIFESDDSRFSEHFVPCMVYLPIKSRVHNTVSFNLRLKPVGHENIFQNHR